MRTFNRLASLVLGIVLFVAGALLIAEAVALLLHRPPLLVPRDRWYQSLAGTSFGDRFVFAAAIAITVVGVLVLALQLRPWRPVRLKVPPYEGWHVQRHYAERSVVSALNRLSGVSKAKTRLNKRWRVRVRAAAHSTEHDLVAQTVNDQLRQLDAPDHMQVKIRLARLRRVV